MSDSDSTKVDPQFVMNELAAQRNKAFRELSDELAVAHAFGTQMKARCAALEAENAEFRERLAKHETAAE